METLASCVKIMMTSYEIATGCKFTLVYQVDVYIKKIREKDLSLKLRELEPVTLDKAVGVAAKCMTNKKECQKCVCKTINLGPIQPLR